MSIGWTTIRPILYLTVCLVSNSCSSWQKATGSHELPLHETGRSVQTDPWLERLLEKYPAYFEDILSSRDSLGVQVIYTRIDRNRKNTPAFTDFHFNVDPSRYFYPASTVKLPVALLALQRLHELTIAGVDQRTTCLTDTGYEGETMALNDPTSPDGRPSIGQYIKRIFLTSDNEAYNRLYEWLGPAYINEKLSRMGYPDIQIRHRLEVTLREDQNRHVNPVRLLDDDNHPLLVLPERADSTRYAAREDTVDGVNFSRKNRITLTDLHAVLRSVIFPASVSAARRFTLTKEDYSFLYRLMSERPSQTVHPAYDTADVWDAYVKYLLLGGQKGPVSPSLLIFNKIGQAYGFLIDVAYIVDTTKKIEFFLSAVIRCNPDRQLGDLHYDYDQSGFPFLQHLGEVIYTYELGRPRKNLPDLSSLHFTYDR